MAGADRFRVVIAGGGVAALEAVLALSRLAGERAQVCLLAGNAEFAYRPMTVAEPFGYAPAWRLRVADVASAAGAALFVDQFGWVDPARRVAHTDGGGALPYDALLVAVGARVRAPFPHGVVIDDRRMDEILQRVLEDLEGGAARRVAFVTAARLGWQLPIYELALMTARWADESGVPVELSIVTPERAPLEVFGETASAAVDVLLRAAGVAVFTAANAQVPARDRVVIAPGDRELAVDRVLAMPILFGPAARGLPAGAHGFIPVDTYCQVRGVERVWAAGDATDFAVKHGGVAAQQADTAAQAIAALAGAPVSAQPLQPEIRAVLLTGGRPLYLSARLTGGHGFASQVSEQPPWAAPTKIAARYLAPYLDQHDNTSAHT